MRIINLIVVHCSATRGDCTLSPEDLDRLHRRRGFNGTGYHYYIRKDGTVHLTRPVERIGAHVKGFNANSIGICYEGGLNEDGKPADTRTAAQRFALIDLLTILRHQYPEAQIAGHYQLSATIHKACPCYDPRKEYSGL